MTGYQKYLIKGKLEGNGEIEENHPQQAFHRYGGKGVLNPRKSVIHFWEIYSHQKKSLLVNRNVAGMQQDSKYKAEPWDSHGICFQASSERPQTQRYSKSRYRFHVSS